MTATITTTGIDPFAVVGTDLADELEALFAADKAAHLARKAEATQVVDVVPVAAVTETVKAAKPVVNCAGCGRPLRAAKSRALRRGPVCQRRFEAAVKAESAGYSPAQVAKAVEALGEDDAVQRVGHLFLVTSSDRTARYECSASGECTCVAAFHGRRCWHVLTARIAVAAGWPQADPDEIGFAPLPGDEDGVSYSTDRIEF